MKALKYLFSAILITGIVVCCKKENKDAGNNNYTYQGQTYKISGAEYLYADGDVYLFFNGGMTDYVQVIFADAGQQIPEGSFTHNGNRYNNNYDSGKNFWTGAATYGSGLSDELTGGTVNITKSGENYQVSFDLVTEKGPLKGNYSGKFAER